MGSFLESTEIKETTYVDYLDQSAFDEKFEIELDKDYIGNLYHIENKYFVPVLAGGYREMYHYTLNNLIYHDDANEYARLMNPDTIKERFKESKDTETIEGEFREKLVDGSYRWVKYLGTTGIANGVPKGKIYFYVYDLQKQKDRLHGLSSTKQYINNLDAVTGLRKRLDFFPAIIKKANNSNERWCCIVIDIQRFNIFNSWLGFEKGNYLLSKIGTYLSETEKKEDGVAAYFGYDNFAIFLRFNRKKIEDIYNNLKDIVYSYSSTVSFLPALGVFVLERNEKPGYDTYDKARLAAEEAKKSYTERICYFDSSRYNQKKRDFEFLSDFQSALENNEITFYIQPQCHMVSGRVVGGEALARWIKKDNTVVSPGVFIPFLEENGLITELDKYMWESVFRWMRSLFDRNITPIPISINVSQIDLLSIDVAAYLYTLSNHYHVSPKYIKVEITESAYAENFDRISSTITDLKNKGFMVYLDDFGTGYSSLNILDKINVDVIKLDMVFMHKDSSMGKKGTGIVESILAMTKALELQMIVEGVENKQQVQFLRNLGFKYAQGYYFYKPISIEEFEKQLDDKELIDHEGLQLDTSDLFRAQEFLKENMFTESTLNRILGAVAYYILDGKNLTISRFNEPFRNAIGDSKMDSRIENIQNYIVTSDHEALYNALSKAENNASEGGKCEIRFFKSDGSVFWFNMHFYFLRNDGNKKLFFGKVEDTTEQREQSIHFFDVLRKQSDVTIRIVLDKNEIQYVTGENTLYNMDLPSVDLDKSIYQTALFRIENEEDRKAFLNFFDGERLREAYKKAIYHEILNIDFKLSEVPEPIEFSTYYIRYSRDESLVVYAFAKKRDREILRTDPLTGMNNRYAYNDSIDMLKNHKVSSDKLIVFLMDINGLKEVNDTYGHQAGDELIKSAAHVIYDTFKTYGECFRISGDEFAALIYADEELAEELLNKVNNELEQQKIYGQSGISISSGYECKKNNPNANIDELIKLADSKMYQSKSKHYQRKGVDRRMQQVAFNAICDSYTKVLKANLTEDTFEIISASENELTSEKGYAFTISSWLKGFADKGLVHPKDKEHFQKYTDIKHLRKYFQSGNRHFNIIYRRRIDADFYKVMMEIIPAPDYSNENQKVFMYVKNIGTHEDVE